MSATMATTLFDWRPGRREAAREGVSPAVVRPPCQPRPGRTDRVSRRGIAVWAGVLGRALCRLLPARNAPCRVLATALLLCAAPAAAPAEAQQSNEQDEVGRPPGRTEAVYAAGAVSRWIRSDDEPDGSEPDPAPSAHVVAVTVRVDGRVVGDALVVRDGEDDDRSILREAATLARDEMTVAFGAADDLVKLGELRAQRERASISVELGGRLVPLSRLDLAAIDQAAASGIPGVGLDPGREGLAVRRGNVIAARAPSAMTLRGADVAFACASLVASVTGDGDAAGRPLVELSAAGLTFYRYRTIHLVQNGRTGELREMTRGGEMRGPIAGIPDLRELASALVEHLAGKRWPGNEKLGIRGDYDPLADRYASAADQFTASPVEQALVVSALASVAACEQLGDDTRCVAWESVADTLRQREAMRLYGEAE